MTAIGVIILLTQILPSLGYNPKEDADYVNQFKAQAEEVILKNILKDEAGDGILVLENFEETIDRASLISQADILKESEILASKNASGTIGALEVMPRALKKHQLVRVAIGLGNHSYYLWI